VVLRALFFDLGGTLFDSAASLQAQVAALQDVADAYNLGVTGKDLLDAWNRVLGPIYEGQPERWIPIQTHLNERFVETLRSAGRLATGQDIAWFEEAYLDHHLTVDLLYPDVRVGLARLANPGLHLGVLSDVDEVFAKYVLRGQGIHTHFASVTTSEAVGVGKPTPAIFHAGLAKAHVAPSEAAMVGDSLRRDIEGAKAVGMVTIQMDRHGTPLPLADHRVQTMDELVPLAARLAGIDP